MEKRLPKLRKWIDIAILVVLAMFSFSIPCFSNNYPQNYITIGLAIVFIVLVFLKTIFFDKKVYFGYYLLFLLLFILSIFLSQLVNKQLSVFPKSVILLGLFSVFLYQFSKSYSKKNNIFFSIMVGGLIFAVVFFVYYRNSILHFSSENRLGAEFNDQNQLGRIVCVYALIAFVLSICGKKLWVKILSVVSFIVFSFIVITTGSISNILSILLTILIAGFFMAKRKWKIIYLVVVGVSALLITVLLLSEPMTAIRERLSGIIGSLFGIGNEKDGSAASRLSLAINTFKLFLTSPVFGKGYFSVSEYNLFGITGHNNYFQLLSDFGLLGFLAFEFQFFYAVFELSFKRKDNYIAQTVTIFLIIFQLFLTTYHQKMDYLIMPVVLSCLEKECRCVVSFSKKEKGQSIKSYLMATINNGFSNDLAKDKIVVFLNNLKNLPKIIGNKFYKYKKIVNSDMTNVHNILKNGPCYIKDSYYRNAFFGHSTILKAYTGCDSIFSKIEHGLYFGDVCMDDEINHNYYQNIITMSNYRSEIIKKHNNELAVNTIGPYIAYANSILQEESIKELKMKFGKTLLVIPSHSIKESTTLYDKDGFVSKIDEIRKKHNFQTVIVCIFYQDILNDSSIVDFYKEKGFIVTTCGNRLDNRFLSRQRALFELCDVSMSNSVGTHIGYSIYLNKPHYYFKQEISRKIDAKEIKSEISNAYAIEDRKELGKYFVKYSEHISKQQYEICNYYFGLDLVKTKDEMASLFKQAFVEYNLSKEKDDEKETVEHAIA